MIRTGKPLMAVIVVPLKLQALTSTWPADATRFAYIKMPFWIAAPVDTIAVSPTAAEATLKVTWVQRPLGMPLSETEPLVAAPAMSERVSELLATSEAPTAPAAISAERTEPVRRSLLVTAPSLILPVDTALAPMSAFFTCPSTMSELRTVLAAYAVPAPRAMTRASNEHTFENVSPRRMRADMSFPLTRRCLSGRG